MRKSLRSEVRMLREIVWHIGTAFKCYFCRKPLLVFESELYDYPQFGESVCPPVKTKLAIHHIDEDHFNNRPKNRALAHSNCHRRHHIRQQHAKADGKRIGGSK